jgi:hypothetical protein
MLNQEGYSVKQIIEAGQYIYSGLTTEQKETLATKFYAKIEEIFVTKHRDYAEAVFTSICPSFLARDLDV